MCESLKEHVFGLFFNSDFRAYELLFLQTLGFRTGKIKTKR